MDRLDLIIFDLDGTLLDTAPDVLTCANRALEQLNLPLLDLRTIKKAIGPGTDNFIRFTLGDQQHLVEEFYRLFRECYREKCVDETRPYPGIVELLNRLDRVKLAIATNKPLVYTEHILERLDLTRHFDLVAGPELVKNVKPHPEMIFYTLQKLNVKPQHTILVGDTDNDILSARAAGIVSCAVGWGYMPLSDLKKLQPQYVVESPEELLSLLEDIQQAKVILQTQD